MPGDTGSFEFGPAVLVLVVAELFSDAALPFEAVEAEDSRRWPLEGPLFIGIRQNEHLSPVRLQDVHVMMPSSGFASQRIYQLKKKNVVSK